MRMRATKIIGMALVVAVAGVFATTPGHANCGASTPFQVGMSGATYLDMTGLEAQKAYVFYWAHQSSKQAVLGYNATGAGLWGNDSGATWDPVGSAMLVDLSVYGLPAGAYGFGWDWSQYGSDGCVLLNMEPSLISCQTFDLQPSLPVMDMTLAFTDPATLAAKAIVFSADGNEAFQNWTLDQCGAAFVNGDYCVDDAYAVGGPTYVPGPLPVPAITSVAGCDLTGCTLNVTVGSHEVPIITDCEVAASKLTNCTGPTGDPRNLYIGRQLFVKRAACTATAPGNIGTFDTRTFIFNASVIPETVTKGFVPYAPQDLNLNGIVDGTEVAHVPVILAGNALTTVPVKIPKIALATDCVYLGVGLRLDSAVKSVCGGACTNVVTPVVSVNPIPLSLDTATAVGDKVINLTAGKVTGKANVSWNTTAELSTAGFNLIGVKKSGGDVQLNSALIPAQKGTTGESASYSINLGPRDLKGSTAVYVELVKISGAKERFGPASF